MKFSFALNLSYISLSEFCIFLFNFELNESKLEKAIETISF